ncbi:MAG: 3-hydroxyacyl-CoA dehydrogenase NAD-binding domain-containing protein [Acidobacteriota bacterium]
MSDAFHLNVGRDGLATLTFDAPDRRVNVFDRRVLDELDRTVDALAERDDVAILVLVSGKETNFIAGADVDLIAGVTDPLEAEAGARFGQRVFASWEALPFPTVAAIRGTTMGGGTELALASTYRVVSDWDGTKIGLPEVKLGILPGWGGCTRLPRLVGIEAALDTILTGRNLRPKKALRMGLADAMVPDAAFLDCVRDFARERIGTKRSGGGGFDLKELLLEKNPLGRKLLFDQATKQTVSRTGGNYPAPLRAIEVVRTGVEEGLQAGFNAEARALGELATSRESKCLIHVFRLMEGAKKLEGAEGAEARAVKTVGVLGAGVMGGGIAQLAAAEDLPVRMKDIAEPALASGMEHAAKVFRKRVKKRRLTDERMRRKMNLVRPTLDYTGFERVDLVIEAVVEDLGIKQKVFAEVAGHVSDETVLASNTSSLSIDRIGERTPHRERVVGMHFFNPVDKMPLVEVIAGEHTAPWAVETVFQLSKRLGKTPVVVKDGPGFLVNRLLVFTLAEALWLLDEGHRIEDLDRVMKGWGMPMGPIALTDEVGIDVAVKVAHILHDAFGDRLPLPAWLDRVVEDERLGKKNGRGFYRYDKGERGDPDKSVYKLLGLKPKIDDPDPALLIDRMALPMVDEAARCLDEGIVRSPEELDLAMIFGTGFPPFRGGLCKYADDRGLDEIVETLDRLAGEVHERYRPSEALQRAAETGGFY